MLSPASTSSPSHTPSQPSPPHSARQPQASYTSAHNLHRALLLALELSVQPA